MATSGCSKMAAMRPMARFHLPFASLEETMFRVLSSYLLSSYFACNRQGEFPDLEGLKKNYTNAGEVNHSVLQRMHNAVKQDSALNAVVMLDCFATLMPFSIEAELDEIQKYF